MGQYFGIFKMQFKGELQYRAKAISGMSTQVFWGLMYICLYSAFMKNGIVNGITQSQMTSYVWLGQAFFAFRVVSYGKNVSKEIISGDVCYKFTKPIDVYNLWFSEYCGEKLSATLLRFPLVMTVAFLLPSGFGLSLPVSIWAFVLFLFSLAIGFLTTAAISMFIVNIVFKTLSPKGATSIITTICSILGGAFIPLPLLPQGVQNVLNYLPFRFISDLPFRIYIGNIDIIQGLKFCGISLAWLIVLLVVGKILIKKSLKKVIIQGG